MQLHKFKQLSFEINYYALSQEHVSQTDGWFLHWILTLQVYLELVTYNKIVATPSPNKLVATNLGALRGEGSALHICPPTSTRLLTHEGFFPLGFMSS